MRHYPDLIEAYLKFTSNHESTNRVRKWSFISVIAALMERRLYLDRGHYTLFPNLFVFIIGPSGLIKKSTSTGIAVDLFRAMPKSKLMSERLTGRSLIDQLSLAYKPYEFNGETIRQSPLFAYASELAVFMTEVFGSITELLTTFYDCIPRDPNHPWVHRTKADGDVKIFGPCLNILGASTTTWLQKCIPRSEMEGGFTSRVIFVVESNPPDTLVAWPSFSPELHEMKQFILEDMVNIYTLRGPFHVEQDAHSFYETWYKTHMLEVLPANCDSRMTGYLSRKPDAVLKLAMIRSVSLRNDLNLIQSDIEWGIKELTELEPDWIEAFDPLDRTKGVSWQVRSFIENRKTVLRSVVLKALGPKHGDQRVMEAIRELVFMDEVLQMPSHTHKGDMSLVFNR